MTGSPSPITHLAQHRPTRLFVILGGIFITNALLAEFIGVKIFSLDKTLGFSREWSYTLFGMDAAPHFTVGVLLWPIIQVVPAPWWPQSYQSQGLDNAQLAYATLYGQGIWIIAGSLIAFLVGQILDVFIFHRIKAWTGERAVWLRATGSTVISQLVDSYIVIYVAFVLGPAQWSTAQFLAVSTNNYLLKVGAAVLLTPGIYLAHGLIDRWLGQDEAQRLRVAAMGGDEA